ncbi:MAG: tetratricopeptide repeat protein [Candidatus Hodarchaeota archaeon]
MGDYCYDRAQEKLRDALTRPNVDKETKRRFLLQAIELSLCQGETIHPELLTELKSYLGSAITVKAEAETLHAISMAERRMGHYNDAVDFAQKSLSLYRTLSNPKAIISVLNTLAQIHASLGQWLELCKATTEALQLARVSGDFQGYGQALINCAVFERERGFHNLARDHYELASQILEDEGDKYHQALVLNNLADLAITQGDLSRGLDLWQQALFQWRTLGHRGKVATILAQMGRIHKLRGNLQAAEGFLSAADELTSPNQTVNPLVRVYALCETADFERTRGNLNRALRLARDAIPLLEQTEISGTDLGYVWGIVTSIYLEMKETFQAEEALAVGEAICSSLEFSEGIVNNILLKGVLELQKGNLGLAQEHLENARKNAGERNYFEILIQAELSLADLYLRKLSIEFDETTQKNAANCLMRASNLAENTALEPRKLEAKMLEAVARSINLQFESAAKILNEVEARAHSLELYLIEEKARQIKIPVRSQMRALNIPIELDEEMQDYILKAQEYIARAKAAFRDTLERF